MDSSRTGDFLTYPVTDGVTLYVYPAPAFKTVTLQCFVQRPLDEETTSSALLPAILRRGCRRLPTRRAIAAYLERLYGASLQTDVYKLGERHVLAFRIDTVHDRFAPARSQNLARAVDFLFRLLAEPSRARGRFPDLVVEQEKANHRHLLEGLIDDRATYAAVRCVESMCPEEPYRRYSLGRVEDLATVDSTSLTASHRRLLLEATVDLVVTGAVRGPEVARLVRRAFRFHGRAPAPIPPAVRVPSPPAPREIREPRPIEQGHLVIGARAHIAFAEPLADAFACYNGILGAFPHSRLFRHVREREGLAYDVRSWIERSKGFLFVYAGIDPARYGDARDGILREIDEMRKGGFSEEEWTSTRRCLLDRFRALEDSPARLASVLLEGLAGGRVRTIEEARRAVEAVTREAVVAAARAVQIDTLYFLTPAPSA